MTGDKTRSPREAVPVAGASRRARRRRRPGDPAVRIGAIAASGLAGLPFGVFLAGLLVGNGLFVSAHLALGHLLGPAAERVAAEVGGVGAGVAVLGALAVLAAVGWAWLRRRRGGYGGWVEGACPACLALTAIRPDPE